MSSTFILWSTRLNGWQTRQGTYSSNAEDAREYQVADACAACAKHYDQHGAEFGLIPVEKQLLDFIKAGAK